MDIGLPGKDFEYDGILYDPDYRTCLRTKFPPAQPASEAEAFDGPRPRGCGAGQRGRGARRRGRGAREAQNLHEPSPEVGGFPHEARQAHSFNGSGPPVHDYSRGAIHPSVLSEVFAPQPPPAPSKGRQYHRSQWTTIVDSPDTQLAQLAKQAQNGPPPNPFLPVIPPVVRPRLSLISPGGPSPLRDAFYSQPNFSRPAVPMSNAPWANDKTEHDGYRDKGKGRQDEEEQPNSWAFNYGLGKSA